MSVIQELKNVPDLRDRLGKGDQISQTSLRENWEYAVGANDSKKRALTEYKKTNNEPDKVSAELDCSGC